MTLSEIGLDDEEAHWKILIILFWFPVEKMNIKELD
jgi:hypothetical protein